PGRAVGTLVADSPAASVPASVTVPADAVAVNFPITTSSVTAPTAVSITGSFGGSQHLARLNVTPQPTAAPVLASVTVTPTSVTGLSPAIGAVALSAPAPAGRAGGFVPPPPLAVPPD